MQRSKRMRFFAAFLVLATSAIVLADDSPVIPPDELVYCTVCHGVQLMGNSNIQAPRLSGMDAWYVKQQLRSFRNGWRGTHEADLTGMEMRPMAAALSDTLVDAAAAFANAARSPQPAHTIKGNPTAGKNQYMLCAACHGARAEGNEALGAPALAGLNDWYLVAQLDKFRDGTRGTNPEDAYGQQMRASAQILGNDQAVRDIVRYITTLHSN